MGVSLRWLQVIPMLPEVLCQDLCSLNPGEDRLAFSVLWELTPEGEVLNEWFGKTIIHSCVKLSYEHAQVRRTHTASLLERNIQVVELYCFFQCIVDII